MTDLDPLPPGVGEQPYTNPTREKMRRDVADMRRQMHHQMHHFNGWIGQLVQQIDALEERVAALEADRPPAE